MSQHSDSAPKSKQSGKSSMEYALPHGTENLSRLKSSLNRNGAALDYLFGIGLNRDTITKFHLGIKAPYRRRADGALVANVLCYPLLSRDGDPLNRYGYVNLPGVTENVPQEGNWSPGGPAVYFSAPTAGSEMLLVVDTCQELWLLDQHIAGFPQKDKLVVAVSSRYGGIPAEWKTTEFWAPWVKVYFGHRGDAVGEKRARDLARLSGREVFRIKVPEGMGHDWSTFFLSGGTAEQLKNLLKTAPAVSSPHLSEQNSPDQLGEFAVAPVNINAAFVKGYLYYPFTVERRELEVVERKGQRAAGRVVTSYVTKVLRSDGAVLDVVRLAAPRGTSRERRVLALTDGTRIEKEPQPGHYATWQLDSLQAFIKAMQTGEPAPHRPLKEILTDVISHLRYSVWLPHEEDYTVLALYVALSFVYGVFDAIPLIFVQGEKGTGKSELGDAVARVSYNATVIGQGSAAGVVRLLNEARGLIVLDDLESVGRSLKDAPFGDINQMLKLSYKKRTGRKAIADRNGKTTVFDFYGPKVVNNTSGVDPVLGSRMFHIHTRRIPETVRVQATTQGGEPDDASRLRDELHVWGAANARAVHEKYVRWVRDKSDRLTEIAAPLRAISELADDEVLHAKLELALRREELGQRKTERPVELLEEAINNCIRRGATQRLASAHLRLEMALLNPGPWSLGSDQDAPIWQRPEWVGNQLHTLGIRKKGQRVTRVRLYGIITRVYEFQEGYVRKVLPEFKAADNSPHDQRSPLSFCEETTCSACIYDSICARVICGLKDRKALNRGRSGRKVHTEAENASGGL